ncbi:Haloacid dehalogenase-like hydrolase domain-containing protein 3 [Apophysomyces sp. BC1034]|nr:Haloacid dehalogenase-like hydrolase domain-containing protein 3 [Apophysomyces sp. BC1021]KAG0193068.1 Haloacid dehalogenase-like hydrolase domain-containing protein 3 [Apophysomyces sp. BC1034]
MPKLMTMNQSRIKLITFDAFNTLFKPKGGMSQLYVQEAAKMGIKVSLEDINRNFSLMYKHQVEHYPFYGRAQGMTSKTWWENLVYTTFIGAGAPKSDLDSVFTDLFETLYHRFTNAQGYDIFVDVVPNLKALHQHGFRMGVVSNSDERIVEVLQNLQLAKYLDFIMSSVDAGCEKPATEFFNTARAMAGPSISAKQILHVGDDEEIQLNLSVYDYPQEH